MFGHLSWRTTDNQEYFQMSATSRVLLLMALSLLVALAVPVIVTASTF
jgi:hypothetical protein